MQKRVLMLGASCFLQTHINMQKTITYIQLL